MNRLLVTLGVSLIVLGLAWSWVKRLPLFRLPGDIVIDRPGFKFFFPITTMLLISALISLIAWVLRR
jgi:ribose/xylose/arabinose/galactoside ABC-type transport system permease subunit